MNSMSMTKKIFIELTLDFSFLALMLAYVIDKITANSMSVSIWMYVLLICAGIIAVVGFAVEMLMTPVELEMAVLARMVKLFIRNAAIFLAFACLYKIMTNKAVEIAGLIPTIITIVFLPMVSKHFKEENYL